MTESEVTKNDEESKETDNSNKNKLNQDIIKQVEYYFGDMNLPRDKYLQEQIKLDDGWVPLDVMITFHRLAKLSTDSIVISSALLKSDSGLLEVSEDGKKIRRNPENPLPEINEERRKELVTRTIYAKGFPKDANIDHCLQFFKDYPDVENLIMRKYQNKSTKEWCFKGSVFVTFKTKEQAENFLQIENITHGETELIKMWQADYIQTKQAEFEERKSKKLNKQNAKEDKLEDEIKLPTGATLHLADIPDKVSREDIKESLQGLGGEVAFVDFKMGDREGWVRLQGENTAKDVFDKCTDGKLSIKSEDTTINILQGDEEKVYLEKQLQEIAKRRQKIHNNKSFKKGKSFGGGRGRKRKAQPHKDAPKAKQENA